MLKCRCNPIKTRTIWVRTALHQFYILLADQNCSTYTVNNLRHSSRLFFKCTLSVATLWYGKVFREFSFLQIHIQKLNPISPFLSFFSLIHVYMQSTTQISNTGFLKLVWIPCKMCLKSWACKITCLGNMHYIPKGSNRCFHTEPSF